MQSDEREKFGVLVLKYLDRAATNEEIADLEQRLRSDPEAVQLFSELARLDNALPEVLAQFHYTSSDQTVTEPASSPVEKRGSTFRRITAQWRSIVAGILVGAILCGSGFVPVVAGQSAQVQQLMGTLAEFRKYVQQFVGAFRLALDTDNEPGPTAIVAGYDRLIVTGAVDPQIIEKVVIDWGVPNEVETINVSHRGTTPDSLARLHVGHRYAVKTGQSYVVEVRAIPWESQRATIESLQRSGDWLVRRSSFLGTPQGLIPMQSLPVALQLVGGQTLVDDELTIHGTAFATGSLSLLFTTSEGRRHVLLPPTPVSPGQSLSLPRLPFNYVNGTGMIDVVFSTLSPTEWPSDFQQPSGAAFPETYDFDSMSAGTRRWPIAVTVDLPAIERRVAKRVFELGGSVKIHMSPNEVRTLSDLPAGRFQIQTLIMNDTPIHDLRFLRGLGFVQGLQLASTPVDDAAMKGIHLHLTNLNWIILSGSQVTDETIIEEVAKYPYLEYLSIGSLPMLSNRSIETIADHLPNLVDLTMDKSNITTILPLARLKKLTRLQIQHSQVPEAEFEELQRLRPDLKIMR